MSSGVAIYKATPDGSDFIIRDINKKKIKIKSPVAALCRCGGSSKRPFCDGSHLALGFKD